MVLSSFSLRCRDDAVLWKLVCVVDVRARSDDDEKRSEELAVLSRY